MENKQINEDIYTHKIVLAFQPGISLESHTLFWENNVLASFTSCGICFQLQPIDGNSINLIIEKKPIV